MKTARYQEGFDFLRTRYTAPVAPFQPTSDTSVEAAEAIEPHRLTQERRVYIAIRRAGAYGRTMGELEHELDLKSGSVCARVNALADPEREGGALIVRTEQTRLTSSGRNAAVYVGREIA